MIQCSEINQNINYLLETFQDCSKLKASDMRLLVELIAAVNTCANGGTLYNTLVNNIYEPDETEVITYYPEDFHAISIVIVTGSILYQGITLTPGTSINIEFTTTNQQPFIFTVNAGSKVLVERIVETFPT